MKKVQVLLSTFNGEKYLTEQLKSLIAQEGIELSILVRDDGSSDSTQRILSEWQEKGLLRWYQGRNVKPTKSFLDLMQKAAEADYYAFCDQDDVWQKQKLKVAVDKLDEYASNQPSMYFSKAQLVDENLHKISYDKYPKGVLSFGQAIVCNNATGCTIVFNKILLNLVNSRKSLNVQWHDQWLYLVCLAVGGNIYYDSNSYINYRQHKNNVVGGNMSVIKRIRYKIKTIANREQYRKHYAQNLYYNYRNLLTKNNISTIRNIIKYEDSLYDKYALLKDKNMFYNGIYHNMMFVCAVIFNQF